MNTMDTTKKFLVLSILAALGAAGCGGKNVSGSYTGTDVEVASTSASTTSNTSSGFNGSLPGTGTASVTVQLQSGSNNSVTGTWNETGNSSSSLMGSSANASAQVIATFDGSSLQIANMILPFGSYSCVYSGSLAFSGQTLTGSLNGTQTGVSNGAANICPVRNITLTQTNT